MPGKQAMILAAGLGTRLKPWTDSMPKALVPYNGKPLLQMVIEVLKKAGYEDIVINIHHKGDQILDFLDASRNFGLNISISDERKLLLDTGGGLKKAMHLFRKEPVLVHNVDVMTSLNLNELHDFHVSRKSILTLAVKKRNTSRALLVNAGNLLCGWHDIRSGEKIITRSDENLVPVGFSGIYMASPEFFRMLPEHEVFPVMPEILRISSITGVHCFSHDNDTWTDLGRTQAFGSD
jgi:NDP-sugar pyrophosphorylase family protein